MSGHYPPPIGTKTVFKPMLICYKVAHFDLRSLNFVYGSPILYFVETLRPRQSDHHTEKHVDSFSKMQKLNSGVCTDLFYEMITESSSYE